MSEQDKNFWAAVFMICGALSLGYNVGSMLKIASFNSGQAVAEVHQSTFRGE